MGETEREGKRDGKTYGEYKSVEKNFGKNLKSTLELNIMIIEDRHHAFNSKCGSSIS